MDEQKKVWDSISESWHNHRQRAFPEVEEFAEEVPEANRVLDVGCGNCRQLFPFRQKELFGVDFSEPLLRKGRIYSDKYDLKVELIQSDASGLPFRENSFDVVICIATLHCLEEEKRLMCLKEIKRVLRPSSLAFLSVWNKRQPRFFFSKKDVCIPWCTKGETHLRYYHLFTKGELEKLIRKSGLRPVKTFYDRYKKGFKFLSKNIFSIVKKE
jgi:ubiquinone/menaquinone biosynthesis C-methylase UbiE